MKFSIFLIAATALASGQATAQSSVNVFGVADAAMRMVDNDGARTWTIGSGGYAASRLGVRATEALGDGLYAGAWMEGTVNYNNGTGNSARLWNRRATVSLGGKFGELRMGHDLTPSYTAFGEFDVFGVSGLADQGKFYSTAFGSGIEATGLWARADNIVSYFTPDTLGGFYANVAVAAGEGKPAQKYRGTRLGYADKQLNLSAAIGNFDGIAGMLRRTSLSASYNLPMATLIASTVRNEYLGAARLVTQIGAVVPLPVGKLRANYTWIGSTGTLAGVPVGADDATQLAVGYTYDVSRRTTLYATYVDLRNQGNARFAVATAQGLGAGGRSRGAETGISHRF